MTAASGSPVPPRPWCLASMVGSGCDLAAQDGVLHAPTPTVRGRGWDEWFRCHAADAGRPAVAVIWSPTVTWPAGSWECYAAAVFLLEQILERLGRDGMYGIAWLQLAGDGQRLHRPTVELRETLLVEAGDGAGLN
jgi:hypothetical protein